MPRRDVAGARTGVQPGYRDDERDRHDVDHDPVALAVRRRGGGDHRGRHHCEGHLQEDRGALGSEPAGEHSAEKRKQQEHVGLPQLLCTTESLTNLTLQCRVWQVQDPLIAELTYREVGAASERVRAIRRAITLPLRLLAAVDLGGAVVVLVIGQFHLLSYFAPAFLTVLFMSAWWYRRYASTHGLLLPARPWVLILAATLIAAASMSRLGVALKEPWISDFGPCLGFSVGMALAAAWLRSGRLALTAVAMVTATAVVSLAAEGDIAVALQLAAYGALLLNASANPPEKKDAA